MTYSVSATAFILIHGRWALSASHVGGAYNLVISAEFTLWMRVKEANVLEGTASDKYSGRSGCRTAFGLYRVNMEAEWFIFVFLFQLGSNSLLLLGEREDRRPAFWSVPFRIGWRGLIIVVGNYFSQYIVFRVRCGLTITLGCDHC